MHSFPINIKLIVYPNWCKLSIFDASVSGLVRERQEYKATALMLCETCRYYYH